MCTEVVLIQIKRNNTNYRLQKGIRGSNPVCEERC
jgi:hypothetical protein